jgi:hypothetical protein
MLTDKVDPNRFSFPLIWTVGFSGKRHLPPGSEERVAKALDLALHDLRTKAGLQHAHLTAVSSIARGADVLFAQACQKQPDPLPWKCLLPFPLETFLEWDLKSAPDVDGKSAPVSAAERESLHKMAVECLAKAQPAIPIVLDQAQGFLVEDDEMRDTAYQECGYRVVDESDVMIVVLRAEEMDKVRKAVTMRVELDRLRRQAWEKGKPLDFKELDQALARFAECNKAGTMAATLYAYAAKHPCILLNADAEDPWNDREILNDPLKKVPAEEWFSDRHVTAVLQESLAGPPPENQESNPCDIAEMQTHAGPDTVNRRNLWTLMGYLGDYANTSQKATQGGLGRMLMLHLVATGLAATLATGFGLSKAGFLQWRQSAIWVVIGIAFLATCKPLLAVWAYLIERKQHHKHQRENWLHARVLAELCRGMWAMWQLPRQPLDAADEEDFPKLKRLLRTLRIMRELDTEAATQSPERLPNEIQEEADMRQGTENYIRLRLHDQARYYQTASKTGQKKLDANMRLFHVSLWGTIAVGAVLALFKWWKVWHGGDPKTLPPPGDPWLDPFQWLELLVIMGPFLATYALARITLLDCRRRARRFDEMQWFLLRLADTLRDCTANSSRLKMIEHAERMMIEEQHEWFSATRNFSI